MCDNIRIFGTWLHKIFGIQIYSVFYTHIIQVCLLQPLLDDIAYCTAIGGYKTDKHETFPKLNLCRLIKLGILQH